MLLLKYIGFGFCFSLLAFTYLAAFQFFGCYVTDIKDDKHIFNRIMNKAVLCSFISCGVFTGLYMLMIMAVLYLQ